MQNLQDSPPPPALFTEASASELLITVVCVKASAGGYRGVGTTIAKLNVCLRTFAFMVLGVE